MTEAEIMANAIQEVLSSVKTGSLRFWGEWFGRPYDNQQKIVSVGVTDEALHMLFDEGERLSIQGPNGLDLSPNQFRIRNAKCVRWEWYLYGHSKTPENLRFMEFTKSPNGVFGTSNGQWLSKVLQSYESLPAVEIL